MTPVRIALAVNEGSGGGTDAASLAAALTRAGAEVESHPFSALDGLDLAGVDRLVIAAGDGGVGTAAAKAGGAGIPLGVLPSGTANDFAGFLDIPEEPDAGARLAADAGARLRRIEVLCSGHIPFVNAAACGLSVAAARNADPLKAKLGAAAYAAGALRAGLSEDAKTYRVLVDGREAFAGEAWQVIVSATGAFGNGSEVDVADPDDGKLDVTILHGSRATLPLRAWGMRRGGLTDQAGVRHFRGQQVDVEGADGWNVDGEQCGHADAGQFRLSCFVDVVVP